MTSSSNDDLYSGHPLNSDITRFIVQLLFIIILSRVLDFILKPLAKQPMVVSEVIAGVLLGPSVFGNIPGFSDNIFPKTSLPYINIFAQVGLILFMFIIGLELDEKLLLKNFKKAGVISFFGILCPFGLGSVVSLYLYTAVESSSVEKYVFVLFLGLAMSITAFPVLARILSENHLISTKVGLITLSAAAVDDVVAWCFLALVVAIMKATSKLNALWTVLLAAAWITFMFAVVRPFLKYLNRRLPQATLHSSFASAIIFMAMFMSAWWTEVIGIHAIFGAFLLGIVMPRESGIPAKITEKIEDLVVIVFLPLYFTYSGLRTQLGMLNTAQSWAFIILVILAACIGKIGGCTLAARWTGQTWRESFALGVLMNAKGMVELIVLNIGLDTKVINDEIFTVMVVMALTTTFITTPLVHFIYPRKRMLLDQQARFDSNFSVLLCASDRVTALKTSILACTMLSTAKDNILYALRLVESSDRLSVYMRPLPEGEKGVDDKSDEVLSVVFDTAKAGKVAVHLIRAVSTSVEEDILKIGDSKSADLIVLGATPTAFFNDSSSVSTILKNARHNVGVFVDCDCPIVGGFSHILMLYMGLKSDLVVLKLARKMSKKLHVPIQVLPLVPVDQDVVGSAIPHPAEKKTTLADGEPSSSSASSTGSSVDIQPRKSITSAERRASKKMDFKMTKIGSDGDIENVSDKVLKLTMAKGAIEVLPYVARDDPLDSVLQTISESSYELLMVGTFPQAAGEDNSTWKLIHRILGKKVITTFVVQQHSTITHRARTSSTSQKKFEKLPETPRSSVDVHNTV